MVSRAIENAQKKVEARNFDIRKHVLQYDDVMNTQRELIYKQRRQILEGHDTREVVLDAIAAMAQSIVEEGVPEDVYFEEWDPSILVALAEDAGMPKGAVKVEDLRAAIEGVRREQEGREKLAKVIEAGGHPGLRGEGGAAGRRDDAAAGAVPAAAHRGREVDGPPGRHGRPAGGRRPAGLRPAGPADRVQDGSHGDVQQHDPLHPAGHGAQPLHHRGGRASRSGRGS